MCFETLFYRLNFNITQRIGMDKCEHRNKQSYNFNRKKHIYVYCVCGSIKFCGNGDVTISVSVMVKCWNINWTTAMKSLFIRTYNVRTMEILFLAYKKTLKSHSLWLNLQKTAVKKEAFTSDISDIGMPNVIFSTVNYSMYTYNTFIYSPYIHISSIVIVYMWSPNMTSAKKLIFFLSLFSLQFAASLISLVYYIAHHHLPMCHYAITTVCYFLLLFAKFSTEALE